MFFVLNYPFHEFAFVKFVDLELAVGLYSENYFVKVVSVRVPGSVSRHKYI